MTKLRLDTLKPGTPVKIDLAGREEFAFFLGVFGDAEDRMAKFAQSTTYVRSENVDRYPNNESRWTEGAIYTWEAYRYNGRWVFGSSAETLRLIEAL